VLYINIALATFGLIGTLAAFGGETWRKGDTHLFRRVTGRGWIAIICLLIAFTIGIFKEIKLYQRAEADTLAKQQLEQANAQQREQIKRQIDTILSLQSQISDAARNLAETTDLIGEQQLASIEAAFKLAIKSPRETDDAFLRLDGRTAVTIPSRYHDQMLLYWGDQFYIAVMAEHTPPSQLATLKLEVGGRTYPLHDGVESGFFERTLRIYGNSPKPMPARILNPQGLRDVELKIFVRTTDSSQGQEEFRRMILSSPFADFARRIYKVTTGDVVNMRSHASITAPIRSKLLSGSFVRVLQKREEWTEVITPEGRQGWVSSNYLGEIE
jgi:hypothetical protein